MFMLLIGFPACSGCFHSCLSHFFFFCRLRVPKCSGNLRRENGKDNEEDNIGADKQGGVEGGGLSFCYSSS